MLQAPEPWEHDDIEPPAIELSLEEEMTEYAIPNETTAFKMLHPGEEIR
jgi:hypothetical protein